MSATAIQPPGAHAPDRRRWVTNGGLRLAVHEWGDPDGPVLFMAHGGFDFARTFDIFAPLLADAGWRVVCWDQRGGGESDHAELYAWEADIRDGLAVLDATTRRPVVLLGHSKGGSVMMQLAEANPHRCSHLVNIDGLPSRRNWPDVPEQRRTKMRAAEVTDWLAHRARSATRQRRPGTLEELAERRGRMNPRLTPEWLRYLVQVGATETEEGWRWKLDPVLRFGGFGPWRPEWSMMRMPGVAAPTLGILGLVPEVMGWGTQIEDVVPWLPPKGEVVAYDDTGHFVHIEQPERVASDVLRFLGPPPGSGGWGLVGTGTAAPGRLEQPAGSRPAEGVTVRVRHNRCDLALHQLRGGEGTALLLLHGLAERSPVEVPERLRPWPGPVWALDFTGHGESTIPTGGGYSAEQLMGDADAALAHLGSATLHGRGLGAYIALLLAGARPDRVRGAMLADGPGMMGGGNGPGTSTVTICDAAALAPPDPFALAELSRDPRPPDYATSYVHLAVAGSTLESPLAVVAVNRPDWLAAVVAEPGVLTVSTAEAMALYAGT